jgi:hypothetical protein
MALVERIQLSLLRKVFVQGIQRVQLELELVQDIQRAEQQLVLGEYSLRVLLVLGLGQCIQHVKQDKLEVEPNQCAQLVWLVVERS